MITANVSNKLSVDAYVVYHTTTKILISDRNYHLMIISNIALI